MTTKNLKKIFLLFTLMVGSLLLSGCVVVAPTQQYPYPMQQSPQIIIVKSEPARVFVEEEKIITSSEKVFYPAKRTYRKVN